MLNSIGSNGAAAAAAAAAAHAREVAAKQRLVAAQAAHKTQDTFTAASASRRPAGLGANLKYGGGPLIKNPQLVHIYAGSYWNTKTGRSDQKYFNGFKSALVHDKGFANILAQYGIGKASVGRSVVANPRSAPSHLNPSDVQAIVRQQLAHGTPYNKNAIYTVYAPPGTSVLLNGQAEGGYHSTFTVNGKPVRYAVVSYGGSPGTQAARDNTTIFESHEYAEAATDPVPGSGYYDSTTKFSIQGKAMVGKGEIGDVGTEDPAILHHRANYGGTSAAWSRGPGGYAYQQIWSNRDHRLEASAKAATLGQQIATSVSQLFGQLFT